MILFTFNLTNYSKHLATLNRDITEVLRYPSHLVSTAFRKLF